MTSRSNGRSVVHSCTFETERLLITSWHTAPSLSDDLAATVMSVMSGPVTRTLPDSWRGSFDRARAEAWIAEVDDEATGLLVVERESHRPVGLLIVFGQDVAPEETEVRIGYMLSEPNWGKGFASELVAGLVGWCRSTPSVIRVIAGVERTNAPSIRVLEKAGFEALHNDGDEMSFALDIR